MVDWGPVATSILLLRHAQSVWNAQGRWQGWADPPLSPGGERAARGAAAHGALDGIDATASSDLQRAARTAELLAGGEAPAAVTARAVAALHRIAEEWPEGRVLAVTHGALIRLVEAHTGAEPVPVPNLAGRWVDVDGDGVRLGARVDALAPADRVPSRP